MFDFEKEVARLQYKVTPQFGGVDDLAHDIPEPSNAQVIEFNRAYRQARMNPKFAETAVQQDDNESDGAYMQRVLEHLGPQAELAKEVRADIRLAIAGVCSNTPSADEMEKWVDRAQMAFFAYILGALTPEL